jgi:hypothetical protein
VGVFIGVHGSMDIKGILVERVLSVVWVHSSPYVEMDWLEEYVWKRFHMVQLEFST